MSMETEEIYSIDALFMLYLMHAIFIILVFNIIII